MMRFRYPGKPAPIEPKEARAPALLAEGVQPSRCGFDETAPGGLATARTPYVRLRRSAGGEVAATLGVTRRIVRNYKKCMEIENTPQEEDGGFLVARYNLATGK